MGPGYDISAAAALSCFHVFALQSRGAFDVRWGRGGLTPSIFLPWQTQLEARGNVELRSGARVAGISEGNDGSPLSVAVVGQEDAPILAGELGGRLDTARCGWRVRASKSSRAHGTTPMAEIVITLVKAEPDAYWSTLFKAHYV